MIRECVTKILPPLIIEPNAVVYSKQEEEVDVFERRLSIVDPKSFEDNARKIREQVALMRTRVLKSELNPKEYPKVH